MKRNGFLLILSLSFSLVIMSGCQKTAENTNSMAPAASPTTETIDTAKIETDLLQMERDWVAATINRDVATVSRIEADDIVMTYPDGSTGTKVDELKVVQDGAVSADSWEMAESKVNVLDANAAVVTGRAVIKNGKVKDAKGKTFDISGEYRFTDVFSRRNGAWQAVASQLTQIGPNVKPSPSPAASPAAKASSPEMSASPAVRASPPVNIVPPSENLTNCETYAVGPIS